MNHEPDSMAIGGFDNDDADGDKHQDRADVCPHCATNSGIYDVSSRCCCVRLVANMPRRLRLAHYGRLSRDFGADVARDMAEAVKLFYANREEART